MQAQNKQVFPPYGLPPNYTPPNENVNNFTSIPIESQQPQSDHAHVSQPMGETHEMRHHNQKPKTLSSIKTEHHKRKQ